MTRCGATWRRADGRATGRRGGRRRWTGVRTWLAERFRRHRGNADVVRQDLAREHGMAVSLRTVERAVARLRQALAAQARATRAVRDPAGPAAADRLRRDARCRSATRRCGCTCSWRRWATRGGCSCQAFRHERQSAWFDGMEAAFRALRRHPAGGAGRQRAGAGRRPRRRDARGARSTTRCYAFARYWGFRPRACAPYRARTKGKDERGVGYVKRNAIAGHRFDSWAALEAHLARWMREVADVRAARHDRGAADGGSSATRRRRCDRWPAGRRSCSCAS